MKVDRTKFEIDKLETFTPAELADLTNRLYDFISLLCFSPPRKGFYPYQEEFAKTIIRDVIGAFANTITGLFSRQSGKSETVANVAAGLMVILPKLANMREPDTRRFVFPQLRNFAMGFKVGIFAPSGLQATTTYSRLRERLTSPEARMFLDSPEFALEGYNSLLPFRSNSRDFLEMNNGSHCQQMTADKQAHIESKTYHMILLDESQDLDDWVVHKSIMPMGSSTAATAVATGTPGTTKGYFYRMINVNKREEMNTKRDDRRLQPKLHFEYNFKEVQKWNANYKKYIIKEKKKIGEDSDEFQQAYNLKWLLERGMAVPESLFEELSLKSKNITTSLQGIPLVAGLDWGKGQDSTVLTVGRPIWEEVDESGRCPVEVIYWWEKLGDNYEEIFAELKAEISKFSIQTIACDATGVGEPLVDRLTWELPLITVLPVKFSAQSKDHLYKWFLLMLQERRCKWPAHYQVAQRKYWKKFKDEMLNLVKEYKNQYLACHAPEDQRNAHDDFPDSLALMLWCINEEAMPFLEVTNGEIYEQTHNWHKWTPGQTGFTLR